ncbi:PIG-L family deacetylase [Jeotgalibacillus sp. S-D1]|uniref:PIG-L deacetylase family protein n=1 Tax=Jeotgalibacillus sp. S-D1 TaxID=2552189 RepID=UPI001059B885|nr:PIG-L family deacetylase [Jeotgalibacillus sp. S-D1]TDL32607.1 PIG-L family deacetylase [Jeotgalibacillus sp. S-D1]
MNIKKAMMSLAEPVINPATKFILKRHYNRKKNLTPLEPSKHVLILAPHMDDETIGLGGTIYEYKQHNTIVHCAFITDGASSNGEVKRADLSAVRKKEIDQVKDLLGIHHIYYLDTPDGQVKGNIQTEQALNRLVQDIQPEVIYTTGFVDAHPDHVATAELLSRVLKQNPGLNPLIRQYEINCPVPPDEINCIIDISSSFPVKKEATKLFKSQIIAFDGFLVLSKVKSQLLKNSSPAYVETFIQSSREEFISQTEQLETRAYAYHSLFKQANRTVTLLWAIYKNIKLKKKIYNERTGL